MKINSFKKIAFFSLSFFLLLFSFPVLAVCPVCTVAVSACVGLSRYLGVDDTITGLWIGGLIVSSVVWTIGWLNQKNIKFLGRKPLIVLAFYLIIIGPLYYTGVIGHDLNERWGIDKLILGIILGTTGFILGVLANNYLKKTNDNQVYFPFQKVALPIIPLLILSIIFYYLTC